MKKFLPILTAALLVFAMAIPCFAYGEATDLPRFRADTADWDSENYPAVLVFRNADDQYWAYASNYIYCYFNEGYIDFESTFTYKFNETSGLWVKQNNTPSTVTPLYYGDDIEPLYSSIDIKDVYSSEVVYYATPDFFTPPVPMAEQIQGVATETLQAETLPAVAGTMTTLTLCGVGLMALLVVLSLFGKRSLISRG